MSKKSATRQQRRSPSDRGHVVVPADYWKRLASREPSEVCRNSGAAAIRPEVFEVPFLGDPVRLDVTRRLLLRREAGVWATAGDPYLELVLLLYLLGASPEGITGDWIGVRDLRVAHFFRGPHELRTAPLVERYGEDPGGFIEAAAACGGTPLGLADAAFRFEALPKVPLAYLYWGGDADFPAEFSVLFDRSIEAHLAGDAIWGTVNLVTDALTGRR